MSITSFCNKAARFFVDPSNHNFSPAAKAVAWITTIVTAILLLGTLQIGSALWRLAHHVKEPNDTHEMISNIFRKIVPAEYTTTKPLTKQERVKKGIIELMNGIGVNTTPTAFNTPDKNGKFVLAPSQFALDLPRSKEFNLNNETKFSIEENITFGNLNDVPRSLYDIFEESGANRIMNICNQSTMGVLCTELIAPLIDRGDWSKQFPNEQLIPSNVKNEGLVYDVNINNSTHDVIISIRNLMQLKSPQSPKFVKYFIIKSEIRLPLNLLQGNEFANLQINDPRFHLNSTISPLTHDLTEAKEKYRDRWLDLTLSD